jgi:hypothetical protein
MSSSALIIEEPTFVKSLTWVRFISLPLNMEFLRIFLFLIYNILKMKSKIEIYMIKLCNKKQNEVGRHSNLNWNLIIIFSSFTSKKELKM